MHNNHLYLLFALSITFVASTDKWSAQWVKCAHGSVRSLTLPQISFFRYAPYEQFSWKWLCP